MKKKLFVFVFLLIIGRSFGQSIECEIISIGIPSGISIDKAGDGVLNYHRGLTLATEVRLNYLEKRVSTGLQFSFTGWNRTSQEGNLTLHQNPFVFSVTGDYNFINLIPKVVPFAGIGIGYSVVRSWPYDDRSESITLKSHAAFVPRIGVEFFKRIRLTGEYQYLGNGNNFFNIRAGFVVGS